MIRLIIGNNASGKTLYLKRCIKDDLDKHNKVEFITNFIDNMSDSTEYNQDRINILGEVFCYSDGIDTSNDTLGIINNNVRVSKYFLEIITLLCKDYKRMYIDEPEQGLSIYEINLLCNFLQFADKTYENLTIVTHSEMLIQLPYYELYTVKMNESSDIDLIPVMEDKKFEVID